MDAILDENTGDIPEYEISGIENIARGVCIVGGHVLLCRPKKGGYTYLPGGHIEFGEKGAEALMREVREETGLEAKVGEMVGVVESQFNQNGKAHAEISLVYAMTISGPDCLERLENPDVMPDVKSQENWIEFTWWPVDRIDEANLLPPEMKKHVRL